MVSDCEEFDRTSDQMAEIVTCQNLITLLVLISKENLRLQSDITDLQRRRKSYVTIQFDQELLQKAQSATSLL